MTKIKKVFLFEVKMFRWIILIMVIATLNQGFSRAEEVSFKNGKITYTNNYENEYSQGEIEFGEYEFEYDKIKIKQNGSRTEYMFGISEAASDIFKNADVLPGSRGTVHVKDNIIEYITFGNARVGEDNKKGIPLIIDSFVLTENGIEKIENGFFELNKLFKIDVEKGFLQGVEENWGKSSFYYNKNFNQSFSFEFVPLNLEPTLNLDAQLNISPEKFEAEGSYSISIFKNQMSLPGFNFPSFLTKDNPYKVTGKISYDKLTNVFYIRGEKEIKSGALIMSASKNIMVTADVENFGIRYGLEGEFEMDLTNVASILKDKNVNLDKVSEYTSHLPADERLMIWTMQFYMKKDQIIEMHNQGKKLSKDIELTFIAGYDPKEISKGRDYIDWNLLKVDLEIDGDNIQKQFEFKR